MRYSNKTNLQMSPNPGKEKLIPSLFHPVTAYESDQKSFNLILDALFMIFAKPTLQFIIEKEKDLKNVHAYALLKPSTRILVEP